MKLLQCIWKLMVSLMAVWGRYRNFSAFARPGRSSFFVSLCMDHSAQSWGVYSNIHVFHQFGPLHISELGLPFGEAPHGIITLCQFRDNILLASTYKESPSTPITQTSCDIVCTSWNLHVLCDCMSNPGDPACMPATSQPESPWDMHWCATT